MAIKTEEPAAPIMSLDEQPQTPSTSPRKRKTAANQSTDDASPRKKATASKIPTSFEEASEEDKMLIRMKEEGRSWSEIREAWEKITGVQVGGTTLGVRYTRLKANFTVVDDEDIPRLIEAKKMIEGEFEREKYNRIAKAVTDAGGKVYNGATLQKKIKELVKSGVCDS